MFDLLAAVRGEIQLLAGHEADIMARKIENSLVVWTREWKKEEDQVRILVDDEDDEEVPDEDEEVEHGVLWNACFYISYCLFSSL